ncbi:MAG: 3-carboxy-cis,cis-muconate cycloisomerase [Actinobacteria bacterium]|nr:3-carboxy-cis,cis-muconate cycloisomerase [Actinomycetota bacterium]
MGAQTGDAAWLRAMLDFEAAFAGALADVGLAAAVTAEEIMVRCAVGDMESAGVGHDWDIDALGAGTARDGTPVPALLAQLRTHLSDDAKAILHRGATSQDVVDTAAMLVAKRALVPLLADLDAAAEAAAALAERHRADLAAGRTLLQQAAPITFGLRAANWLSGFDDAAVLLAAVRDERLAVQLGGAAGNLAALGGVTGTSGAGAADSTAETSPPLGDRGLAVADALARRLDLAAPAVPWHSNRSRPVELAAALGQAAGAAGKVGTDVVLLAQTEVAEVAEGQPGASSAMPHKRNPTAAVTAAAAARRTPGLVATMFAAMPGEQERAAGAWQAEAETLAELLRLTGVAVAAARRSLEGLEVFPDRMRANVEASGDLGANDELIDRALAAHRARTGGIA